jgi:hypothetical protein
MPVEGGPEIGSELYQKFPDLRRRQILYHAGAYKQ